VSSPTEVTEVLVDQKSVMGRAISIFSNAKGGLDILTETMSPPQPDPSEETKKATEAYFDIGKRGGHLRILTRIDEKNLATCKELAKSVELRHLDELKGNFAVSDSEYMSSPTSTTFQPNAMVTVIYSNAKLLVQQNRNAFETFWNMARPAEERFREIEEGIIQPTIQILRDPHQIQGLCLDLVKQARSELLLILPTANAFHREVKIGVIEALSEAASERGVKVSIISPNSTVQEALEALSKTVEVKVGKRMIGHRRILEPKSRLTVTILVVDRRASLTIEQKDDSAPEFDKAIDVATYSTRNSTVLANINFFERVWNEVELREREEVLLEKEKRSRKTAEVLQDVLSHDIRNYNQASLTRAELLRSSLDGSAKTLSGATTLVDTIIKGKLKPSELNKTAKKLRVDLSGNLKALNEADALIAGIMKSTKGSGNLIDRAKQLGRVISQDEIRLHPVDLEGSIRNSISLVTAAHPDRRINTSFSVKRGAQVIADEMLEEVFTNILSNSVNYTERDVVPVEITVEEAALDGQPGKYWKITFTDQGRGIPDSLKEKVFERYLKTSSGTGLGLSIVYALAVERYSGKVRIANRIEGDHTKGTRIELLLPKVS
jgi:two-component system, OmpR family, sensor histidine kinase VicK